METIFQDIRYGVRTLLRKPGFAAVAVITLALGIGANTAIFSVINGVILRQLLYKDPGRLTIIWNDFGEQGQSLPSVSPGDFNGYRDRAQLFEEFASAGGGPTARRTSYS